LPPGVPLHLRAQKPEWEQDQGDSLGAHLRRRRRALGLQRSEAAKLLGADERSLMFWERDEREPVVSAYPAVIEYLGYEPWPAPMSLGHALLAVRRRKGLEVRKAAALAGVDEGTWRRWERGEWKPTRRTLPRLDALIGISTKLQYPADVR
jgi:transcriptional regulator with XRE-family HTH domain